jgi:hypothetical protein
MAQSVTASTLMAARSSMKLVPTPRRVKPRTEQNRPHFADQRQRFVDNDLRTLAVLAGRDSKRIARRRVGDELGDRDGRSRRDGRS